jgi:hypothetical protein
MPRHLRCPNRACRVRLTWGAWDWWEFTGALLGGLTVIPWFPRTIHGSLLESLIPPIVALLISSSVIYPLSALLALNLGKLRSREPCPEFRLPPL